MTRRGLTVTALRAGRARRTVRLRLTLWSGGLFLICGTVLLAVTYGLVVQAFIGNSASNALCRAPGSGCSAIGAQQEQLIEALLTLARGQAGLDRQEPFDLGALTRQVLAARLSEAEHQNLTLHADLRPARAAGSPRLAERLAANLVDNALRHNIPGGRINITTGTRNSRALLSVANTGTAIPAAAVDRLFRPFQRLGADRTSRGEGTGLGLSIVQAIADAHGADITSCSQRGGGLLVEVTFPDPDPRTAKPRPNSPKIHIRQPRPPSGNSAR